MKRTTHIIKDGVEVYSDRGWDMTSGNLAYVAQVNAPCTISFREYGEEVRSMAYDGKARLLAESYGNGTMCHCEER